MDIRFDAVYERDIDLLVINSFSIYDSFKDLFGFSEYNIIKIIHSLSDDDGESDITVIFNKDDRKVGLLIEDKINAPAMPDQRERYSLRGDKGIKEGLYDSYLVYMIAPKEYLDNNYEAKKYENRLSYEKLLDFYKNNNNKYAVALIEQSLEKKESSYVPIPDEMKTNNWKILYQYVDDNFPKLRINHVKGARGPNAIWPIFKCSVKNCSIFFKTDRNVVDLTISNGLMISQKIKDLVEGSLDNDMYFAETGKSLAIRINVPHIDFNQDFNNQLYNLRLCLESISRLYCLFDRVDFRLLSQV